MHKRRRGLPEVGRFAAEHLPVPVEAMQAVLGTTTMPLPARRAPAELESVELAELVHILPHLGPDHPCLALEFTCSTLLARLVPGMHCVSGATGCPAATTPGGAAMGEAAGPWGSTGLLPIDAPPHSNPRSNEPQANAEARRHLARLKVGSWEEGVECCIGSASVTLPHGWEGEELRSPGRKVPRGPLGAGGGVVRDDGDW